MGFPRNRSVLCWMASLAVVLLTGCGGSDDDDQGSAGNKVNDVEIGVLMPLSGAQAEAGKLLRNAAEFAADEINSNGGIKSLGGAKLKLLVTDTQGEPETGQAAAQRLVLQDKVTGLIGAYNSTVTIPVTAIAERNRTPIVIFSAVAPEITQRGFKYTFRPNETATGSVDTMIAFLKEQEEKSGEAIQSYAVVFENSDFGKSTADAFDAAAEQEGWNRALSQSYAPGSSDFTPIAVQLRSAQPDFLLTVTVTPDANTLYKAFNEQNVEVPVAMDYSGSADPPFDPLVAETTGLFSVSQWDPSIAEGRPWIQPHVDGYKAKYGELPHPAGLQAYSDVYVWAEALEQAGTTDREKLRETLAGLNISVDSENPALILPYDSIRFDETGQNPDANLLITQNAEGKRVAVYPASVADESYEVSWMGEGGS